MNIESSPVKALVRVRVRVRVSVEVMP